MAEKYPFWAVLTNQGAFSWIFVYQALDNLTLVIHNRLGEAGDINLTRDILDIISAEKS